uniref:Peptidase M14 domain-containing protein n=2 Tax=Strongyloides stercoralis TaxID=6248 RepID=A0AAF5CQ84_STRER
MEALLVEIKGCCSTGAESKAGNRNTEQSICGVDLNRNYPYKWNKIYNICIRFPGISKESEHEVKSYTDYLVKNKNIIQGFNVGQSADILYGANGCSNDYAKSLGIKYVFTIEIGSRKIYNFGFMVPKSYISKIAEEVFAGILVVSQRISKENTVESNIK